MAEFLVVFIVCFYWFCGFGCQ